MTTGRVQSPSGTRGSEIMDMFFRDLDIWPFFLIPRVISRNSCQTFLELFSWRSCRCFFFRLAEVLCFAWARLLLLPEYCYNLKKRSARSYCLLMEHWNGYRLVGIWRADARKHGWTLALNSRVTAASAVNRVCEKGHGRLASASHAGKVLRKRTEENHKLTNNHIHENSKQKLLCVWQLLQKHDSHITPELKKKYEIVFCIK